jgi:hypothetical protein
METGPVLSPRACDECRNHAAARSRTVCRLNLIMANAGILQKKS